jgi:hypothetical protein
VTRSLTVVRRVVVAACLVAAVACRRGSPSAADALAASLIFDNASEDMREALSMSVDYRITEDNFARWQEAQGNLEQLPRSAMWSGLSSGRSAIDRAISRLESSPRSRTAIESAGISVRDFVLETIALAQATEAAQTGKSTSPTPILADNDRFVRGYRSGILGAQADESQPDTAGQRLEKQADDAQTGDVQLDDMRPDDMRPDDMHEQERIVIRMQMEAILAARMAEMRSQRDFRRLQERIQRQIDAALRQHGRSRPTRDSLPDSIPDGR